ncbi:class I SAM-dependent methyltransferase [Methylobacterium sp. 285MFTsu5.1]|uniref:class I SAM-dependent methyltransferase n=1 Tax=Methylobacterium sp. 285MFTsu5.1 TaxID=1172187 RepID=UPI00037D5441|nr:class I SAM-dependent methyltransferase [Methylobacterium sp. 285MFTsu5.1]
MSHRENKAHALSERGNDLYETPAVAVRALMAIEWMPQRIWEPACGPGAIVRELYAGGHDVLATDLVDYGWKGQVSGLDFLTIEEAPEGIDCIITNPPYKDARAFVEKAVRLCPRVMMLLRFSFYESISRGSILDTGTLARVYCFRKRLPMMHRDGWVGPKASSNMAHAWFVWDVSHRGPTQLSRMSWEDYTEANHEPGPMPMAVE